MYNHAAPGGGTACSLAPEVLRGEDPHITTSAVLTPHLHRQLDGASLQDRAGREESHEKAVRVSLAPHPGPVSLQRFSQTALTSPRGGTGITQVRDIISSLLSFLFWEDRHYLEIIYHPDCFLSFPKDCFKSQL